MRLRNYFPLGVAIGPAFCNRVEETELLVKNIQNGKHTLLMAARRYGKSSLALHALKLSQLPYVEIDFYMARSEKVIEAYILNGVIELIGKTLAPIDQFITSIKKYVKALKPKLDIGVSPFKLELTTDMASDPASNVKEAIQLLERLLKENQKQAILLFDEFQNIGVIAEGSGIEAAIRHVAQKTKYLTIIFSGSNRKLLKSMFDDANRPLYKLCWKLTLKRIADHHYRQHLKKISRLVWQQSLTDSVIDAIMLLTERHPFYMNKLCDRLLMVCDQKLPSLKMVEQAWHAILDEEKSDAVKEISLLSIGQKKVLLNIAQGMTTKISAKQNLLDLQMTPSSIFSALESLEEKDVLEKSNGQYRMLSPVIRHFVLKG